MRNKQGTTGYCLREYLSGIVWNNKSTTAQCREIVDFTSVSRGTIRRWYTGESKPKGLVLVKVRFFLEDQGYRIRGFQFADDRLKILGRMIAENKLDLNQVSTELGFTRGQELLRVLHGNAFTSNEKMTRIENLIRSNGQQPAPTTVISKVNQKSELKVFDEVLVLFNSLDGLVTLLDHRLDSILSDQFSAEERQVFREKATPDRLFLLANRFYALNRRMNGLCSEKAREHHLTERKR